MTREYAVPSDLAERDTWVCAYAPGRGGDEEDSKRPWRAFEHRPASTTERLTWGTFEEALQAVEEGPYDYPGFVFDRSGIVGVDLDGCLTDEGEVTERARLVLERFPKTYAEVSRSGHGLHLYLRGRLGDGAIKANGVEAYDTERYFIVTGRSVRCNAHEPLSGVMTGRDEAWLRELAGTEAGRVPDDRGTSWHPVWTPGRLRPAYPPVESGGRHTTMVSLAGSLRSAGRPYEGLLAELRRANREACRPPLPDREIERIARTVSRYDR